LIFALAFVAVSLLALGLVFYSNEPSHQGKRLSNWAREYGSNHWSSSPDKAKSAEAAIQYLGADGVPFLLGAIATEPSPIKERLRRVIPQKWHAGLRLEDKSAETRRMGAYGVAALGTNAPPEVISKLIMIITTHPDEDSRYVAAFALRTLGPGARPAIPFFVDCLKTNKDKFIRDEAAIALGSVQSLPEVTVPALIEFLQFALTQGPSTFEATDAIGSLRQIGTDARAALPLLRSLHNHENVDIRTAAHFAVERIDTSGGDLFGLVPTY